MSISLVSMKIMLEFSVLRTHPSSDNCLYYYKENYLFRAPGKSFSDAMFDKNHHQ